MPQVLLWLLCTKIDKEYIKKQIFQESVGSKNYQLYMIRELYIFLYIIHY